MCTWSSFIAPDERPHTLSQEGAFTASCESGLLQMGMLGNEEAMKEGRQRYSSCFKVLLEVLYGVRHLRKSTEHPGTVCRTAVGERYLHCMTMRHA